MAASIFFYPKSFKSYNFHKEDLEPPVQSRRKGCMKGLGGKGCMKRQWKRRARMQGLEVLLNQDGKKDLSLEAGRNRYSIA